jgi:hypothetical protein
MNIHSMKTASVISLSPALRRERRLPRLIEARRSLEPRGRAWINGREVGGTDRRFAHLGRSYD